MNPKKKTLWIVLLAALAVAISFILPATALDGNNSVETELTAAFDRKSYAAGDNVNVTLTLRGDEFDAAGVCLAFDPQSMTYAGVQPANGFRLAVCKADEGRLELIVQSDSAREPGVGLTVATATFRAVSGGIKTVEFVNGSTVYLGGKSCVAYNGYQELAVTGRVTEDAAADAALHQAIADAVAELEADIQKKLDSGVTVAQNELLLRCRQSGTAAIRSARTQETVAEALSAALARAEEIMADDAVEFPYLLSLDGAEENDGAVLEDIYPAFAPENTAYFLYNSRPLDGTPRAFKASVKQGVLVTFNGVTVPVKANGRFQFAVPFRAMENCSTLILKDPETGLSTTYLFYSFGYGVTGGPTQIAVYNEAGEKDPENIGDIEQNGSVRRLSTLTDRVRIGFQGAAQANKVFTAELVDRNGRVLQTFTTAADDNPVSQAFLSDTLTLHSGLNWFILRYKGVDKSHYEDGKPVETEAYKSYAVLMNYTDPEEVERDPSLIDTKLNGIRIYLEGSEDANRMTPLDEAQRKYKLTLDADAFDLALGRQSIHMTVDTKPGQTVSVYGGSGLAQERRLQKDGTYHIADYLDSEVARSDSFKVTITVTAKDGQHKGKYELTIEKKGQSALIVPSIYRDREVVIVATNPYRTWNLVFASVGITDQDGNAINPVVAMQDGRLTMKIADPTVIDWDGRVSGGAFVIDLLKQGETAIQLIYDDPESGLHMEQPVYLSVNYSVESLGELLVDARELLENTGGARVYADGAEEALREVIDSAQKVYEAYRTAFRRNLTQPQITEINQAVHALQKAMEDFRYAEIAIEIIAFVPLDEDIAYQRVDNDCPLQNLMLPKELRVTLADGSATVIKGVTWESDPTYTLKQDGDKRYLFTPMLPAGYKAARGVEMPKIWIDRCAAVFVFDVRRWALPLGCTDGRILLVAKGTTGADDILALRMRAHVRGDSFTPAPTSWEILDEYDGGTVGQYRFRASLIENVTDPVRNMKFVWSDSVAPERRTMEMIVQVFDLTVNREALTMTVGEQSDVLRVDQADYPVNALEIDDNVAPVYVSDRLQWSSSNSDIVEVNAKNGALTAKAPGSASVFAKLEGTSLTAVCEVTVLSDNVTVQPVKLSLTVGEQAKLRIAETLPRGTEITWKSADETIVSVDETGLVTAMATGTANITAEVTLNGVPLRGECTVVVSAGSGKPGGDPGGEPGGEPGGNGGGALNGQPTGGGGDYRDLLTDPLPDGNGTQANPSGTQMSAETQPEASQSPEEPTPGEQPETDGKPSDGNGTGGKDHRVFAYGNGDGDGAESTLVQLLSTLGTCAVLLVIGILYGKKMRGE